MKKLTTLSILILALASLAGHATMLSLGGKDWMIKDLADPGVAPFCPEWTAASVPGNIQADLESARRLNPLWYGAGDPRLYEVAKHIWHYRKEFVVPADFTARRTRLIFDGVDNSCEVWLNGERLGGNTSMFTRFEFEVGDKLRVGQSNLLEVRLDRIPEELVPYIEKSDGVSLGAAEKWRFTNGMQKTLDVLGAMKSGTNFGYDWGVNIWTLGIWKDVRLETSGPAVVRYQKVDTTLRDHYTKAEVRVTATIDSITAGPAKMRFRVSGHGPDLLWEKNLTLIAGKNSLETSIDLPEPALWWPNGYGAPNLYTLESSLVEADGEPSHTVRTRFGVREVRWEPTADAPAEFPEKYMPVVNGRKIRLIGSNFIPPDLLFARIPERAPHLLRLAQAAGFTAMRFWGGGVLYDSAVYDEADELGIMVMLEIFMANVDPKPDSRLLNNLADTLPNVIRQVWNHPSIIEYDGGNEMNYGKAGDFTVIKHIRKIFSDVDPGRLFRDTDPADGTTHGTWNYPLDQSNRTDPIQVYTAWNRLEPRLSGSAGQTFPFSVNTDFSRGIFYIKDAVPDVWPHSMRYGEFGYQTAAHLEVWQRDIPLVSQWPVRKDDPVLIRKNITNAIVTFDDETWLEKPVIDFLFGEAPDLEHLLRAGQYVGAEGLRYAMDAIRRRGAGTGAMLTWDFNEPWTNGAGSYQVDYDGRPLMNYAFVRQAVAPLSLSLRHDSALYDMHDGIRTTLYLSSDAAGSAEGLTWKWRVRDRRGEVVASGEGKIGINPLEVKKLADITVQPPARTAFGPFLAELQLTDATGKIINERVHIFGLRGAPAPLRGLLNSTLPDQDDDSRTQHEKLTADGNPTAGEYQPADVARPFKQTRLQVRVKASPPGGEDDELKLDVTNVGAMTALFVEPEPLVNYRTDTIIDQLFGSIPPGETREFTLKSPRHSPSGLSLSETGWRITCWNAEPVIVEPAADMLLVVGRADQMCREYAGFPAPVKRIQTGPVRAQGRRPSPGGIPFLMNSGRMVEFDFDGTLGARAQKAVLRLFSADQSPVGALVKVELNGVAFEALVPGGYGFQVTDPARLGRTQCTEIEISPTVLKATGNLLRIQVLGAGWFTWDALDLRLVSR